MYNTESFDNYSYLNLNIPYKIEHFSVCKSNMDTYISSSIYHYSKHLQITGKKIQ